MYRATINGIISTTDGARLMFMLRERRCTQEAIDAQVAAAAAAAPAAPSTVHISIGTVPSGCYLTKEVTEALYRGTPLLLENEDVVSAKDYTRAVSSRRADDELDAAIDAAAPGQPHGPAWQEPPEQPAPAWQDPPEPEEDAFQRAARETREQGGWVMAAGASQVAEELVRSSSRAMNRIPDRGAGLILTRSGAAPCRRRRRTRGRIRGNSCRKRARP